MIPRGERNQARLLNHAMHAVVVDNHPAIEEQAGTVIRLEIKGVLGLNGNSNTTDPADVASRPHRHECRTGHDRKIDDPVHAQGGQWIITGCGKGFKAGDRVDFRVEAGQFGTVLDDRHRLHNYRGQWRVVQRQHSTRNCRQIAET